MHPIGIFLRHFQIVSEPKFSFILLKIFYDVFELSPSLNSFLSYQNQCRTFPKSVLTETHMHPFEIFMRISQIVSGPNFNCILMKYFYDVFELSPSANSFVTYQNCCKAFPKSVWGENQLHPVEVFLRHFQSVSQPKFRWVVRVWAEVVGGGVGDPPCIKIGYSSRLVPRAEKGPQPMY